MATSLHSLITPYLTNAGRRAAWNLGWMIGGAFVSQACNLSVVLLLGNALGTERFGVLASSLSVQSLIVLFGTVGLRPIVIREATQRPKERNRIASTYMVLTSLAAGGLALVVVIGGLFAPISTAERILLATVAFGSIPACATILPFYDVHHRQAQGALLTSLVDLAVLGVVAWLIQSSRVSLPLLGIILATKWLILGCLLIVNYTIFIERLHFEFSLIETYRLYASSWPVLISGIFALLPIASSVLIVRYFHGESEAGIMGLATQALRMFVMLTVLAFRVVRPHVSGPYGFSRGFVWKQGLFYCVYFGVLYPCSLAGAWVLIHCMLKASYQPAWEPVCIMLTAALIAAIGRAPNAHLVVMKREYLVTQSFAVAGLVFCVASFLLAPRYGAIGQCCAILLWGVTLGIAGLIRLWHVVLPRVGVIAFGVTLVVSLHYVPVRHDLPPLQRDAIGPSAVHVWPRERALLTTAEHVARAETYIGVF